MRPTAAPRSAPPRHLLATVVLAAVLLAGACGGDDGGSGATTTEAPGTSTTVAATDDASDPTDGEDDGTAAIDTTDPEGDDDGAPSTEGGDQPGEGGGEPSGDGGSQEAVTSDEEVADVDWTTSAIGHRGQDGRLVAFLCPPDGQIDGAVWGTEVYTDDSYVCVAAVHAGLINPVEGGRIVIEVAPGEESYRGTAANGVTSSDYGSWTGSFTFPVE